MSIFLTPYTPGIFNNSVIGSRAGSVLLRLPNFSVYSNLQKYIGLDNRPRTVLTKHNGHFWESCAKKHLRQISILGTNEYEI